MRRVGQILKDERLSKGFTLEQVEKSTRIRVKYLIALELDDFEKLPELPYAQGFLKNYSEFLGLKSPTMLALFRREYLEKKQLKKEKIEEPLTGNRWMLTPNKVIMIVLVFLVIALFGYFYFQYKVLNTPPPLILESPKEELVTKEEEVAVYGKTDTDATVTINRDPVLVKEDGKFYKDIGLAIGNNTLAVEATNRNGRKTIVVRRVIRLPHQQ